MSEDIVVRLRTRATDEFEMLDNIHEPLLEAADEIERLARENAALREIAQDCLAARRERDALREALEAARHALVTTHNLRATDLDVEIFDAHLRNDVPRNTIEWFIDHSRELAQIDAALSQPAQATAPGVCPIGLSAAPPAAPTTGGDA